MGITVPASMQPPEDYEIWPENEHGVVTFLRCQTQWRTSAGGFVGLDYNVVLAMLALYDVPDRAAVLEDIQVMEHRAIEILSERAERESKKRWR